ncbi:MAG: transglutaminase-like domain-containing protein [Candidatus Heimdallarchaeaceae archaeon]
MIEILHVRGDRVSPITSETVIEVGDAILLSANEENFLVPQVPSKKKLHILLISPIGTIVDSDQVDLEETGYKKIYAFPISPDLYSGTYILVVDGYYNVKEKINIRTNKQLLYRWQFYYGLNIKNPNDYPINNFTLDLMIPPNIFPIQQVTKLDINYKPKELLSDNEGNKWIRFYFPQINPNEVITIAYKASIITRLVAYDITRIKSEEVQVADSYSSLMTRYTKAEPFIEADHKFIVQIANKFKSFTPLGRVLALLKFVKENLKFVNLEGDFGAAYAIEKGYGDCTEFASLFVALCRASNVPARMIASIINTETNGWQHHSQAEFFANGIWFPVDPTLQLDMRYFFRDPQCIILQRGNTLGNSPIREIRYKYENMEIKQIIIRSHKDIILDKTPILGTITKPISRKPSTTTGSLFENLTLKYSLESIELEEAIKSIEIKVTAPESAPIHKPFSIPIHLYNRTKDNIKGTLRVSFVRGGIYTNHLYPLILRANTHEPKMVEIPATNFLGKTLIEFIFQDENGRKLAYKQKKIQFQ